MEKPVAVQFLGRMIPTKKRPNGSYTNVKRLRMEIVGGDYSQAEEEKNLASLDNDPNGDAIPVKEEKAPSKKKKGFFDGLGSTNNWRS